MMGAYFIAMNRSTGKMAEENYEILKDGLCASKLFHKAVGNVDSYLDEKKMPGLSCVVRKKATRENMRMTG